MSKEIRAVIIDTGVYKKGVEQYLITDDMTAEKVEFDNWIYNHGTVCYDILTSIAKNTKVISVQAGYPDEEGHLSAEYVVSALQWCLHNDIDVISLSVGTSSLWEFEKFEKILAELIKKDIIVIAAINNANALTCPASIKGVFGVQYDKKHLLPRGKYIYLKDDLLGTNLLVHPNIEESVLEEIWDKEGNSYATPYIAGIVCNLLYENGLNAKTLDRWFADNTYSLNDGKNGTFSLNYSWEDTMDEPILVAVISSRYEMQGLGKLFGNEQYNALDIAYCGSFICRNTGLQIGKNDLNYELDSLIRVSNPDIVFWYIETEKLQDFLGKGINKFFDIIVKESNDGDTQKLHGQLKKDGELMLYQDGEMQADRVFQELCKLLL